MLAAMIVVFREVFEIGLVIGIVLAATRHVAGRELWISGGVLGGILGAGVVALFANSISAALSGTGQEVFNASILAIAAAMLIWHSVWMTRHGSEMAAEMKTTGEAVATGRRSQFALAVVCGTAVLREGAEIVLFLYGIYLSGSDVPMMAVGSLLGLVLGAGVSALMYLGLVHIPSRHLFRVTNIMIALLAAGMMAQSVAYLQQAQIVNILSQEIWSTANIISDGSLVGKALHTLIGYTAQPTGLQLAAYGLTLAIIFLLTGKFKYRRNS